ncbi:MAG: efflux transporter periplasmic adaptor subunit [Hirschia sp.]|nr:efflux transporter periplasmic adaptor subunit [Hirschia sp.]MBF19507.1 efflux transporter periplasmic adaptor subunit [Hirschia sp.]
MTRNRTIALILAVILPIAFIVLGIGSIAVMGALKPKPEERNEAPKALAVFVAEAVREDVQLSITAQGEVAPRNQANLAPQVSGRVNYVADNLVNGGFVKKGQLLMRLEDADYKLSVVRAESTVASARQALVQTEAEADLALRELQDLGIDDASPLALKVPQLEEARASLAAAQAQLQDAQLQLKRTGIYAPFDGMVLNETVDIGQFVGAGAVIAEVFATDVMEVELQISDQQMGELGLPIAFNATANNPGPEVRLRANVGGRQREWIGEITRTGAAIDSRSRLISVYAEVEDPFGEGADEGAPLAPGLFVDASIIGRTVEDVIIIPRQALRGINTVYVVETVDAEEWRAERDARSAKLNGASGSTDAAAEDKKDDKAKPDSENASKTVADLETGPVDVLRIREVEVLKSEADRALLLSGIEPGERVVLSAVQAAFDGMRLRVLTRNADGTVDAVTDAEAETASVSSTEGTN